tara:strand:- start:35 stop:1384 length:1350 start_codon:yes stop_codon:yes gene_type:complete
LAISNEVVPGYNLKERRENRSLDQSPSEVILAESEGLTMTGLMAPTGGGSSDPQDIRVGPQPLFEDLNDKEKESKWDLEKIGYKAKLERLAGIVDDSEKDTSEIIGKPKIKRIKSNNSGVDTTSIVEKPDKSSSSRINLKRLTEEDRMQQNQLRNKKVNIRDIEEATSLSGLSPTYLVGNRQEYVHPSDKEHETKITSDELFSQYNGASAPPKKALDETIAELKSSNIKVSKSIVPKYREGRTSVSNSIVPKQREYFNWDTTLRKMLVGGEADSYDTVSNLAKSTPPKKVTSLTVGELKKWMEQEKENTASGLYQINLVNLNELIKKDVINEGQVFDKDTQDKAYNSLLEKRSFSKFKDAMKNPNLSSDEKTKAAMEMQLRLAKEWASIPIPYDLTKEQRGKKDDGTWRYPNGLKAGMSYYESDTNRVPKKNEKLDFLKYLLSYTDEKE